MRRLFLAGFVAAVLAAPAFGQVAKDGYALTGTKLREALFGIVLIPQLAHEQFVQRFDGSHGGNPPRIVTA